MSTAFRNLAMGDFACALEEEDQLEEAKPSLRVLNYVVERKTIRDLVSICLVARGDRSPSGSFNECTCRNLLLAPPSFLAMTNLPCFSSCTMRGNAGCTVGKGRPFGTDPPHAGEPLRALLPPSGGRIEYCQRPYCLRRRRRRYRNTWHRRRGM